MSQEYKEYIRRFGIGLTGNIGTGKSTVAKLIEREGYTVIDADELARRAVGPKTATLAKIVEKFGAGVLREDGTLDRKRLGAIVFNDHAKKHELEAITHPAIFAELVETLRSKDMLKQREPWFYEAALIFEANIQNRFRSIWCTYCNEAEQIKRIVARDGISVEQAQKIIAAQMPMQEKVKRADFGINTDHRMDELRQNLRTALAALSAEVRSQFVKLDPSK